MNDLTEGGRVMIALPEIFELPGFDAQRALVVAPSRSPLTRKSPAVQGFSHALEWTRTTTGRKAHKALNLARLPIPPRAQSARV
jgi:hypothetical protein